MRVHIEEESVIKASDQFWEQMLAMHLEHVPTVDQCCVGAGHLLASVELSGTWTGTIEVRLSDSLAVSATAAMLMQPPDSVAEADTLDASKEIANMIAGTIKSILPRPCAMTVPQSSVEANSFCGPVRTDDTLSVTFRHSDGDLLVRVWEQESIEVASAA
jgi:CheY-specific phosphatase CheX